MKRPLAGISVPVATKPEWVTDGDTIRVHRLGSEYHFPVRLLDCWAPETAIRGNARAFPALKQAKILSAGQECKQAMKQLLEENSDLMLLIPFGEGRDIMDLVTLGRVLGHVWAGPHHVASYLIEKGLAFETKEKLITAGLA